MRCGRGWPNTLRERYALGGPAAPAPTWVRHVYRSLKLRRGIRVKAVQMDMVESRLEEFGHLAPPFLLAYHDVTAARNVLSTDYVGERKLQQKGDKARITHSLAQKSHVVIMLTYCFFILFRLTLILRHAPL